MKALTKDDIKSFLQAPSGLLRNSNSQEIENILEVYPWFQTMQLFYIISQNREEGIFNEDNILRTAVYAGSRVRLRHLLKSQVKEVSSGDPSAQKATVDSPDKESRLTPTEDVRPLADEKKTEIKKNLREKTDLLIDKIINEQPSVQKPNAEFYSATVMAAKSLQDSDDFVTETLADIFVKQENYRKAIRIYEKLSLLYPEKKDKFAVLIENLRNKITD